MAVDLDADPFSDIVDNDERIVEFEVQQAAIDSVDRAHVVVQVAARNKADPRPDDTDEHFFSGGDVDGLLVNGVYFDWYCFGPVTGSQQLEPQERAITWIGFRTDRVPIGAKLSLKLDQDGGVAIGTSP